MAEQNITSRSRFPASCVRTLQVRVWKQVAALSAPLEVNWTQGEWVRPVLGSHLAGGRLRTPIARGAVTMRAWPKLSLSESLTNEAVAAIMQRLGGHPIAIGSSFIDR